MANPLASWHGLRRRWHTRRAPYRLGRGFRGCRGSRRGQEMLRQGGPPLEHKRKGPLRGRSTWGRCRGTPEEGAGGPRPQLARKPSLCKPGGIWRQRKTPRECGKVLRERRKAVGQWGNQQTRSWRKGSCWKSRIQAKARAGARSRRRHSWVKARGRRRSREAPGMPLRVGPPWMPSPLSQRYRPLPLLQLILGPRREGRRGSATPGWASWARPRRLGG